MQEKNHIFWNTHCKCMAPCKEEGEQYHKLHKNCLLLCNTANTLLLIPILYQQTYLNNMHMNVFYNIKS